MKNDKYLVILHKLAPLSKFKQLVLWIKIQKKLGLGIFSILATMQNFKTQLKALSVLLVATILTLTSITTRADIVVLDANTTGWDAVIDDENRLTIKAINPMVVEKTDVCVLWIKYGDEITMLSKLPDYGIEHIILDKEIVKNIKNAQILISIEHRNKIFKPLTLEYQGKIK